MSASNHWRINDKTVRVGTFPASPGNSTKGAIVELPVSLLKSSRSGIGARGDPDKPQNLDGGL